MVIAVGGADVMLWEITDWADACAAAATPCEVIKVDDAVHDLSMARAVFPEARQVFPRLVDFMCGQ